MRSFLLGTASAVLAVTVFVPAASAQAYYHRRAHIPYYYEPGGIIARAAERAQHEPGVTSELAPDAKQTATGGPVGGVPGFSGGR